MIRVLSIKSITNSINFLVKCLRRVIILIAGIYSHIYLWGIGCEIGKRLKLGCPPLVVRSRGSKIRLGHDVTLSSCAIENPLCVRRLVIATGSHSAEISIGDGTGISCSTIYAVNSIRIGRNVNIGAGCRIFDTDFHPVDLYKRRINSNEFIKNSPVFIEDDVWLCADVTVLKGVTIGSGSVIALGSVVTSNIPSNVIAGGVPAKVLKKL